MYKIAAMGDKDSIYGFASLGVSIFPVTDPVEGSHILRRLAENGYGVIYITEQLAAGMQDEIERYASRPLPSIVPVPGVRGNTGFGLESVSRFVEKAVGSDILS